MSDVDEQSRAPISEEDLADLEALMEHTAPEPWVYDPLGYAIWSRDMREGYKVCDIRGWGHLTGVGARHLPHAEAAAIQDNTGRLIADLRNLARRLIATIRQERKLSHNWQVQLSAVEEMLRDAQRERQDAQTEAERLRLTVALFEKERAAQTAVIEAARDYGRRWDDYLTAIKGGVPPLAGRLEWDQVIAARTTLLEAVRQLEVGPAPPMSADPNPDPPNIDKPRRFSSEHEARGDIEDR